MKKPPPRDRPGRDQIIHWEERAAIMEYDGGMSREDAEEAAWRLLFGSRYLRQTYMEFGPWVPTPSGGERR